MRDRLRFLELTSETILKAGMAKLIYGAYSTQYMPLVCIFKETQHTTRPLT